jgi:hypothetical protein
MKSYGRRWGASRNPRLQRRAKKYTRNILISSGILLLILILGALAYAWYESQYGPAVSTAIPKSTPTVITIKHTQPGANVPEDASVETVSTPITPGSNASINLQTLSGSTCTILVTYNGVASTDTGLRPKAADDYGTVAWSWTLPASVPYGSFPIVVTCTIGKRVAVVDSSIDVIQQVTTPGATQ